MERESVAEEAVTTMRREREQTSFDTHTLTAVVVDNDASGATTAARRKVWEVFLDDPVLNDKLTRFTASLKETRERSTARLFRMADLAGEVEEGEEREAFLGHMMDALEVFDPATAIRAFVQHGLWIGTLKAQGSEAQKEKYLPGADLYRNHIGCFAMTELGHSSFLRGAETSATYDPHTRSFVLSSPSLSSTKWWIGQAGQIATHGLVFAHTLLPDGGNAGIQLFVVPLRDPETGQALPGITIGDIGPKTGRHGNDNGFIAFHNVRLPHDALLSRWAQISEDGAYSPPPNPALAYGSTVLERVSSVRGAYTYASQALTIAIRYGIIRRQGAGIMASSRSSSEPQIMDYQSHIRSLLPHLATTYAVAATASRLKSAYQAMLDQLHDGNELGFLAPLPDMHAASCGLKATTTWWATRAIEACRRSMGGHGYHAYSGMGRLAADFGVLTTGGGDNVVIAQQTARYLLKVYRGRDSLPFIGDSVAYLVSPPNEEEEEEEGLLEHLGEASAEEILKVMQENARAKIAMVAKSMEHDMIVEGKGKGEVWNGHLVELVDCAHAHCSAYIMESMVGAVGRMAEVTSDGGSPEVAVMEVMARIYGLTHISENLGWYVASEAGVTSSTPSALASAIADACGALRPDVVGLTDVFDYPDGLLRSPLGVRSGDVYRQYFAAARACEVNEEGGVTPYWAGLVKCRL